MKSELAGKNYIVTGASRGIGAAAATALVKRGARVAAFGRDEAALARVAEKNGAALRPVQVDVANRAELVAAIEETVVALGGLDGLINNAGTCLASPLEKVDPDEVMTQVQVNFLAAVYACQAAIPYLRKRGGGRILNVTSASARHMSEFSHIGIYSATKAALERYTDELRQEVMIDKIGVTAFSPGGTETAFGSGWRPDMAQGAFAAWIEEASMFEGGMTAETVGEAIANCLEVPLGVAFHLVELRPCHRESRAEYAASLYAKRRENP
jgi:3-oxoacyl-[acyl-carrier protein] reductase